MTNDVDREIADALRYRMAVLGVLPIYSEVDREFAALVSRSVGPLRRLFSRADHDPGDEDRS